MFSDAALGYMKEKRTRNDKVFYSTAGKEDTASTIEQGYVMKNDPFQRQMLVSTKVVPIEVGKWLDEQIADLDTKLIKYDHLQPGTVRPETAERIKPEKSVSSSDHQPDDEEDSYEEKSDEEDCPGRRRVASIRTQVPKKKVKSTNSKSLKGGPSDPFMSPLDARADLVCVPIATGVVMKGKSQKSSFSDFNLRLKFNIDL